MYFISHVILLIKANFYISKYTFFIIVLKKNLKNVYNSFTDLRKYFKHPLLLLNNIALASLYNDRIKLNIKILSFIFY